MKGSLPPSSSTTFLRWRLRGHRAARTLAAGQGRGDDARIGDDVVDGVGRNAQVLEQSLGPSGLEHQLLHPLGDALHDAGVFKQADIARKDRRREEADHLPIGEVPRHHREHRPER